jgi:hypothetical protein
MKDWCYIDIPGWQLVQPALQKFIVKSVEDRSKMYSYISADELEQNCAEVSTLIESYFDVKIERVIVFKMTQESIGQLGYKSIHVDSGPRMVRLNWPILNPESVITKYFKITDPAAQPTRHLINPPYKDYFNLYKSDICQEVSSVCINQPTIFAVGQTPHSMFAAGNQWPRIICSFNFVDDTNLIKYLEKKSENL